MRDRAEVALWHVSMRWLRGIAFAMTPAERQPTLWEDYGLVDEEEAFPAALRCPGGGRLTCAAGGPHVRDLAFEGEG